MPPEWGGGSVPRGGSPRPAERGREGKRERGRRPWPGSARGGGPASWPQLAVTSGGEFRLAVGAGARAGPGGFCAHLCVSGGAAWWGPRAPRLPRSCSLPLGTPCTLNQLFIKTLLIWCPRRGPPARLRALCSPSDKDFPAYQLNGPTHHPSGPLHPLHRTPPAR